MHIERTVLAGWGVRLEPASERYRAELASLFAQDPDNWTIQPVNALGDDFDAFWRMMTEPTDRISFLAFDASGRLAGTSSMLHIDPHHRTLEIGYTWFRPAARGGPVNPVSKLLMLNHVFDAGALRVQFSVDSRNARSQAAMAKLGTVREGVLRRHRVTWTGHLRDTVIFSIIDTEWLAVRAGLTARLSAAPKHPPRS